MPDWSRELHKILTLATAPLRATPDFIIPGEAKCGTSSLYKYLARHPQVLAADVKEPNNFIQFGASALRCRMHFPLALRKRRGVLTGEASAEYLSKRDVPARICELVPEVKLIVLLRNPVTRAFSDYQMLRTHETEGFDTIVKRGVEWMRDPALAPLRQAVAQAILNPIRYIERGCYLSHLERWLEFFPRERFLILRSETLFDQPQQTYDRVCAFLGLAPHRLDDFPVAKKGSYQSPMAPATIELLADFFAPHNRALYQFLGVDFGWEEECARLLAASEAGIA